MSTTLEERVEHLEHTVASLNERVKALEDWVVSEHNQAFDVAASRPT
ncbi:MAG: hypothetical protein J2P25_25505 [Nocardiopsaceae bacterium]|nr:hypothetical protein [Nocardiopsaceae bacterium]